MSWTNWKISKCILNPPFPTVLPSIKKWENRNTSPWATTFLNFLQPSVTKAKCISQSSEKRRSRLILWTAINACDLSDHINKRWVKYVWSSQHWGKVGNPHQNTWPSLTRILMSVLSYTTRLMLVGFHQRHSRLSIQKWILKTIRLDNYVILVILRKGRTNRAK